MFFFFLFSFIIIIYFSSSLFPFHLPLKEFYQGICVEFSHDSLNYSHNSRGKGGSDSSSSSISDDSISISGGGAFGGVRCSLCIWCDFSGSSEWSFYLQHCCWLSSWWMLNAAGEDYGLCIFITPTPPAHHFIPRLGIVKLKLPPPLKIHAPLLHLKADPTV